MSAGTRNRIVRIDDDSWNLFELTVEFRNANKKGKPWTMSDFIRIACREKVAKMDRSRGRPLDEGDELVDLSQPPPCIAPDLFSENLVEDGEAFA